jgi:hypothetical protein
MLDVPQVGHAAGEARTWLERAGRQVSDGALDLARWATPSREHAIRLAKAYLVLVREQSFARGRDALLEPSRDHHERIEEDGESTGLREAGRTFADGRLHLDWGAR